jgi:hypothetical protein
MKKRKLKVASKEERMHTWCGAIKTPVCHRHFAVERSWLPVERVLKVYTLV